jgi:hypothetical protein
LKTGARANQGRERIVPPPGAQADDCFPPATRIPTARERPLNRETTWIDFLLGGLKFTVVYDGHLSSGEKFGDRADHQQVGADSPEFKWGGTVHDLKLMDKLTFMKSDVATVMTVLETQSKFADNVMAK